MIFSVNLSAKEFICADFNVYHKDCVSYSGETDRPSDFTQHSSSPSKEVNPFFLRHPPLYPI